MSSKIKEIRCREFAVVAKRYCRLIESRSRIPKRQFVVRCAECLAELQMHSVRLASTRSKNVFPPGTKRMGHRQWWALYKSLGRKLGKDNGYHLVFDPYKVEKDDPIWTSLSDDLADIYRNLKEGLGHYDRQDATSVNDALCCWKFDIAIHMGHHIVSALRPLHVLIERYYPW